MSQAARTWLVAAATLVSACNGDTVVCGPGTRQIDDVCVPAGTVDDSSCGPGTHLDEPTGECLADEPPAVCGACMAEEVADDGTVTCVCGFGEPREGCHCVGGPGCPAPLAGRVSVCGQLYAATTGDAIYDELRGGAYCDPDNPTADGPCALRVEVYDAMELAGDPEAAQPLTADVVGISDCGQIVVASAEVPSSGLIAVVVDDAGDDVHVRSAALVAVEPSQRVRDVAMLLLSHDTDAAWTAAAGSPFGADTLAQRGVVMTRLISAGAPVANAQLTCGGEPANAYYFSDLAQWTAANIDPALDRTGLNGAALSTAACLSPGIDSGLDAACEWPSRAAAPIPGLFVSEELTAHVAGDPATPCP